MSFKELLKEFGATTPSSNECVKVFRKGLGMTLKNLEEITGVRESHLSAIENGKIEVTQHYAEIFAVAFGVHPTVFLYPKSEFQKSKRLSEIAKRAMASKAKTKKKL